MGRIVLREGDITAESVDAIINAANSDLVLGSGVAGAIREKGGPSIQAECDSHGPVEVGGAVATGAGDLDAKYVLHAASMPPGGQASAESVRTSMRHCLALAAERGCASLAVPAIGAGVAGVPLQRSAEILIEEARVHLEGDTPLQEIRFVLFGEQAYRVFESVNDAAKIAAQMAQIREKT